VKIKRRASLLLLISVVLLMIIFLKMDPDMDLKHRQKNVDIVVSPNISKNNSHHINIINQITSLYEREILDEIRDLEKLRVKIKRRAVVLLLTSIVLL
jgi:hypothetical protein